mmetsp:Transcript_31929/g.69110  ORF Transcript_31929/g.69110 Transcript_31929/m.69110 type:complete len:119 (-) Transcript_31929:3-359(-)
MPMSMSRSLCSASPPPRRSNNGSLCVVVVVGATARSDSDDDGKNEEKGGTRTRILRILVPAVRDDFGTVITPNGEGRCLLSPPPATAMGCRRRRQSRYKHGGHLIAWYRIMGWRSANW